MNKLTIALLVGMTLFAAVPLVHADESNPDCENNVTWKDADGNEHTNDQPWIGYTATEPFVGPINDILGATGTGAGLRTCEGEQWDGQDSVSSYHPGTEPCNADPAPDASTVTLCMGTDPNEGASTLPVRTRVSESSGDNKQAYAAADILMVGRAAVYVGQDGNTWTQAVYLRDNTPGDVLATAVSAPGITKGYVSEGDCDESTYMSGAEQGNRNLCGRDNTAITVVETLP